jgi:hypothetical protein
MKRAMWIPAAALVFGVAAGPVAADPVIIWGSGGYWGPPTLTVLSPVQYWINPTRVVRPGNNVPIAGVNSPIIGRSETRRAAFKNVPAARPAQDDAAVGRRIEKVMQERPLITGTVERVGAMGILIRFEQSGKFQTERFPAGDVFFFRGGGLATAESAPNVVQVGDRVLVPQPTDRPGAEG